MDGDYICSYESISVASANNNNARISDCIKRGTHHANGFLWYIFEDKPQLKVPPYYKDSNYVERYSLAGEYLDTWRTTEAVSKFGCRLLQHCKDGVPYNGYQFKYKSDKREIHGVEQIYQYDMDGNLLRIYHGLHEVRKDLNLSDNINCYHLHRNDSCLERNVAFGFRWTQKYYEELPPLKNYKNKGRPVVQIDPVTDKPIKIFEQMTDFNVYFHIGDACRGKRETDGGYKWKFLTDTGESFYEDNPELLKQYRYYIEDWNFKQSHVKK